MAAGPQTIREPKVMSSHHRDKGDVTAAPEWASRLADRVLVPNVRYRCDIGGRLIAGDRARVEQWGLLDPIEPWRANFRDP
jgi:hypothetical protein